MNKKNTAEPKRGAQIKHFIIAGVIVVALILAFVLGRSLLGEMTTPKKTIEGYLNALYCETKIREMQPYLVEDIRQTAFDDFTLYGQTADILIMMQREKEMLVGQELTLSVKIDEEESTSSTALKAAAKAYGATQLRDVTFTVTFEGPDGQADFGGISRIAQIDGKWYLTEYNLSLTEK